MRNARNHTKTPPHYMGADANGQLGREMAHPGKYNKTIGPYTINDKPEKETEYAYPTYAGNAT